MAVEAKRIKERLKAKYPKANLSNKRLDEIAARLAKKPEDDADDAAIDTVLENANDFMSFEDIAKSDDRLRTLEAKAQSKDDGKKPDDDGKQDPPAPPSDVPAWAQALIDSNKSLKEDLNELKTGKITENKKESARKLFEGNETLKGLKQNIKDNWFNRIDVNSETPVDEQISNLEKEYNDMVQHYADSKGYAAAPPQGKSNTEPTNEEIDAIVEQL